MADLPGHTWVEWGSVTFPGGGSAFRYRCRRCGHVTLSGQPLEPPYNKECMKYYLTGALR